MKRISTGAIFIGITLIGLIFIVALVISTNNNVYSKFTLPLKVEEYFDYSCPHCQEMELTMRRIEKDFGKDVEITYTYFNLFPDSIDAAYAAEAAREQGKFKQYHDAIYDKFFALQSRDPSASVSSLDLEGIAKELKLDITKFNKDRADSNIQAHLAQNKQKGIDKGVSGTPTVYINGIQMKLEVAGDGTDYSPMYDKIKNIITQIKNK